MDNKNGRNRRVQGILAGVAGAALLLGGSTYALWSANDDVAGGKITAGDLNIEAGTFAAFDVSSDRADAGTQVIAGSSALMGHAVTLTANGATTAAGDWRIVPGDTLAMTFPLDVTLQGDNLIADLTTNAKALTGAKDFTDVAGQLSYSYRLFNGTTEITSGATALPADTTALATIASNDLDKGAGTADTGSGIVTVGTNNKASLTYVLLVTFTDTATGQDNVKEIADLSGDFTATLTQLRKPGVGQFK